MAETYKLSAIDVRPRRPWQGQKGGSFISYYVTVEGDQRTFEIAQKADTAVPAPGQEIEANVETREHNGTTYYQLKKVQQGFGGGGARGKSPEERRSIARQHAQKAAMSYAAIKGDKGDLPANFKVSDLKPIIDWLFNDVLQAEKA